MNQFFSAKKCTAFSTLSPTQFVVLAYAATVSVGAILLRLPLSTVGSGLSWIDALFMAMSAICVTGLSVISIGFELTLFGQLVILTLIQIGALGVMTMSTIFAMLLGRRIGLRDRLFLKEDLNQNNISGIVRLVRYVLGLTFIIEVLGAALLFLFFSSSLTPARAGYFAVFHAISAFANAGFDLFGNSFEGFVTHRPILLVIAALFILGGLGFTVLLELLHYRSIRVVSLHTRIVLLSTVSLILVGWVAVFLLEYANSETLGGLNLVQKIWASFFTAVTPRTAGFNVVPTGNLTTASLFLILFFMFVGASPGSTGGGIKTTTFVSVLLGCWRTITGKTDAEVANRRLSRSQIDRAWAIILLALMWVACVTLVLLVVEGFDIVPTLFEVVSAFGTVGLSLGITADLSTLGKSLLVITMFLGRVGPMTLALALGQRGSRQQSNTRMPEEKISLG